MDREGVVKLEWMGGEEARMYVVRVGKLEWMGGEEARMYVVRVRKLGCMW